MRRLLDPLYDTDPVARDRKKAHNARCFRSCRPCGKMRFSRCYYLMFGGGCRQVLLYANGRMAEYPYDLKNAKLCKRRGRHPHGGPGMSLNIATKEPT